MENTRCLLYKDRSLKFSGTMAVLSEGHSKYITTLSEGEYSAFIYYGRSYILLSLCFKLLMVSKALDAGFIRIPFLLVKLI